MNYVANRFVLFSLLFALLLVSPAMLASAAELPLQSTGQEQPAKPEKLTELEQLKLQLSLEKQKRIQAQFDAAVAQCGQQKNIRVILDESDQLVAEQGKLVTQFFADHKVDAKEFNLNPSTGEFVKSK